MSPAEKQKSAPADLSKEYGAPFTIISHDEGFRYNSLLSRDFTPPLSLDFGLIETLGWTKIIDAYCRTLNMEKFAKMKHDAFKQLMLEFYTTLSFDDDDDNNGFHCRLMGKSVTVTRKTLCDIFGFRRGGHKTVPRDFDPEGFCREISGAGECGVFKNGRLPSFLIKDPILLHIHKYISHGVFGRVDSSKASVKDLFYLWCVYREIRVCTPSFLIGNFKSVLRNTRAKMCLGNLITAIAVHFGMFDPLNTDMTVLPMLPLGISQTKNFLKKRKCYKEATAETSSSSDQADGEDTYPGLSNTPPAVDNCTFISRNEENTNPATIDDQSEGISTTPPAVDTWMLITRKLEKMQKQIDELEKRMNDTRARDKTSEQKGVSFRNQESNGTNTVEELKQENFEAKKSVEKLRMEKSESDKAAAIYKTRLDKLLPSIKKIKEGLSKMSSMKVVDLAGLVNDMRELGTFEEGDDLGFPDSSLGNGSMPNLNAEDVAVFMPGARVNSNTNGGNRGNSPQPWTREDDISHTVKNLPGSHSGHNPPPPGSNEYDNNFPEAWISEGDTAHTVKKSLCSQTAHNPPQQGSDDCKGCILKERDNFEKEIENLKTIPLSATKVDILQLEENLEKSRRKCQELKEVVARLNEEKRVLTDRVKLAEENSDRIFTANLKMTNEKNHSISKLNEKIKELENKIMESDLLGKEIGTSEEGLMSLDSEGLGSKRKIVQEIYSERQKALAAPATASQSSLSVPSLKPPAISSQPFGIIGPGLDSALSPSPPPPKRAWIDLT